MAVGTFLSIAAYGAKKGAGVGGMDETGRGIKVCSINQ